MLCITVGKDGAALPVRPYADVCVTNEREKCVNRVPSVRRAVHGNYFMTVLATALVLS